MNRVSDAYRRAVRRLVAGGNAEKRPSGTVRAGGTDAVHVFAGTDLPGREVLDQLSSLVETHIADRDELDSRDLRGVALAAFLFGWESRS